MMVTMMVVTMGVHNHHYLTLRRIWHRKAEQEN